MDDELRMKLANLGSPEALADCIISHYPGIGIPIPLKRIAGSVGIVDIVGETTSSFEGALVTTAAVPRRSWRECRFRPIKEVSEQFGCALNHG
jgi:hypothetical protein